MKTKRRIWEGAVFAASKALSTWAARHRDRVGADNLAMMLRDEADSLEWHQRCAECPVGEPPEPVRVEATRWKVPEPA